MKLDRIAKLAGILVEGKSGNIEVNHSKKGMGQFGEIVVLEGEMIASIAKILGIPDGWKLTEINDNCFGAYMSTDRLALFTHEADFVELED